MAAKLSNVVAFWQQFDLTKVQSDLDDIATEITTKQDEGEESKKTLIESVREFKKDHDESVRHAVAPLIKRFQTEFDSLLRRSNAAEKAFFEVYKRLADASDPTPALKQAHDTTQDLIKAQGKIQDMEIETKQLKETIQDYNKEIQDYKVKEKKMNELQAKVDAYDKNIDATLEVKIKDVTEQMLDEYNEKLKTIEDEKVELEMKNSELHNKVRGLEGKLKETQKELFDAMHSKEERKSAKSEEVEILMNDLEASNERALAAERERDILREKLDTLRNEKKETSSENMDQEGSSSLISDLRRELAAKEREIQHLLTDLQRTKTEKKKETESLSGKLTEKAYEAEELSKIVDTMKAKLESQSDYEAIKKDLAIMRSLEFPEEANGKDAKRPLEVMILERSKTLQSENTSLRVEKDAIAEDLFSVKRELSEKVKDFERQQVLIAELENHVEQLQELSNSNRGEAEGRSSADILVDLTGGSVENELLQRGEMGIPTSNASMDESSKALLPIVQAQRERFRQRNEELEEANNRASEQITLLQSQINDLQSDNLKLYEKIRFLQGFQRNPNERQKDVALPFENRYQSQYEQKMDPFATFSQQERQRRYGQLNVFEKIILGFVRFMMANKMARLFVFAYSVLLHLLVFMVLMKMAYNDAHKRDLAAEWHEKYLLHMEEAHGSSILEGKHDGEKLTG